MFNRSHGKLTVMVAFTLIAAMMLSMVPVTTSAASTTEDTHLTTEAGPTGILGGGDHFFVRFGSDAAFGVVWGTQDNPNDIYVVSIVARYLGEAQVYNRQNELIQANHTIKVYTMYAVKLDNLIEYNDSNQDGMLQYHRGYDMMAEIMGSNYTSSETMYKMVNLMTAWKSTAVTNTSAGDSTVFSFSLSATDQSYTYLGPQANQNVGDNVLNDLNLTFRLSATNTHVGNATIPRYKLTVASGPFGNRMLYNIQQLDSKYVSEDVVSYNAKWDKTIQGWDVDPNNTNPAILLEFESLVGNYIPLTAASILEAREYQKIIDDLGEDGSASVQTSNGSERLDNKVGDMKGPMDLSTPRMTFGGDKTQIGTFEWVTNVTVDGQAAHAHSQVIAGYPTMVRGWNGEIFTGFVLVGGITYPGGSLIVQDPSVSSQATLNIGAAASLDGSASGNIPHLFQLGLLMVGAVIVIGVVLAAIMIRKRPKLPQQGYEMPGPTQSDWSKYYEKK
ncbi:MAG TPA: hypothetical protein VGK23_12335 [Methanomassiliicoccales archaeon]|jgi:hypothetical protein